MVAGLVLKDLERNKGVFPEKNVFIEKT